MSSQAFFWVNVGLGLFLILIFLFGKRGVVAPSLLNLRKRSSGSPHASTIVTRSVETQAESTVRAAGGGSAVKDLNAIFMYNGHSFDAYEVLGLPAGSSVEMAQMHLQKALQKNGSDRLFLEAAFNAIRSLRGA
jgi:hypothetical protein